MIKNRSEKVTGQKIKTPVELPFVRTSGTMCEQDRTVIAIQVRAVVESKKWTLFF